MNNYHKIISSVDCLAAEIRACTLCVPDLPLGANPVLQVSPISKILIAGQAPGTKVHASGIPFDDASGDRLRDWMGVDKSVFYDAEKIAIVPMGFCYPGKSKSGDKPPRPECAKQWHGKLLPLLNKVELILAIGQYAQKYYLGDSRRKNLTETVKNWQAYSPNIIPIPHPSPRNNIWLKGNPWFECELVPKIQKKVKKILAS